MMVQSVLRRKPDKNCPQFTDEEKRRILEGIDANDELRELAQHGFCLNPLVGNAKGQCHCVHKNT